MNVKWKAYNLELDPLSIEFYCPDFEINADGGDERGGPSIVAEAEQEARFAHTCKDTLRRCASHF